MTKIELEDHLKKLLIEIRNLADESNWFACSERSQDLIIISDVFNLQEAVFVGEFLLSIFRDIESIIDLGGDVEAGILNEIADLIDLIAEDLKSIYNEEVIEKFVNLRFKVTKRQIKDRKLKRRRRRVIHI